MSRGLLLRQRWFETGREAFERVTGEAVDGYVCPLCVRVCSTLDDVTLVDVPPKKVGDRRICLICDECNHTSGHTLDDELVRSYTYRDWSRGTLGRPSPGAIRNRGRVALGRRRAAAGELAAATTADRFAAELLELTSDCRVLVSRLGDDDKLAIGGFLVSVDRRNATRDVA